MCSVHGGNRLGANSLLDTLIFGRRSGEHAAARAKSMAMPAASDDKLREDAAEIKSIIDRPKTGRRISEIKDELGTVMNRHVAVFRRRAGHDVRARGRQRLQEEAKTSYIDDRGTIFNAGRAGRDRAGLHARQRRVHRRRRLGAQGVTRRAVPHRLPPNATTRSGRSTSSRSLNGGERPEDQLRPCTITQWQPEERKY